LTVRPARDGKLLVTLHAPEDASYCAELRKHLSTLARCHRAEIWDRTDIRPGEDARKQMESRVAAASLLILLISADHMPGQAEDLDRHLALAPERKVPIVPVLVRSCLWLQGAMAHVEMLPRDGKPVNLHPDHDVVWVEVVQEILRILSTLAEPTRAAAAVEAGTAPDNTEASPPSPPPESAVAPAITSALRKHADSDDEAIRTSVFARIAGLPRLAEADKAFLGERIGSMPFDAMLELLSRHGDMGAPARLIDRFVDELPAEYHAQVWYLSCIGAFEWLPKTLSQDAFADLVETLGPALQSHLHESLRRHIRGCPLFNAVVDTEPDLPPELRHDGPERLGSALLNARSDDDACRRALEARVTESNTRELIRLEWVLSRAPHPACAKLAEAATKRLLESFGPVEKEDEGRHGPFVDTAHWSFVRSWAAAPGPDRPRRMEWLADRVLELESREFSFVGATYEDKLFPADLRLEVGNLLADRGEAPWWAGDVLLERLSSASIEAWKAVFKWWQPWKEKVWRLHGSGYHTARKAILTGAPLPDEAPEDFDDRYLACFRDQMSYEDDRVAPARAELRKLAPEVAWDDLSPAQMADYSLAHLTRQSSYSWGMGVEKLSPFLTLRAALERLLGKPLTPGRATRIARLLKEVSELFAHERIVEIARLAEPMSIDDLPPLEKIDIDHPPQVEAYRLLGGHAADERLRARLREVFEEEPGPDRLDWALGSYWQWMGPVLDDSLRAELRRRAAEAPLDVLLTVAKKAPCLVDKHMLHRAARRQELDTLPHWRFLDLPADMWPLVKEKARRTTEGDGLWQLMKWLDEHGLARSDRADLLMSRLEAGLLEGWVGAAAEMLAGPPAWKHEGPRFLRALASKDQWKTLYALWMRLLEVAGRPPREGAADDPGNAGTPPPSNLAAITLAAHAAFAGVLADLAEQTLSTGNEPRLLALLEGISRLHLGPAPQDRLRSLVGSPGMSDRARRLGEVALTLFESDPTRVPSFGELLEATRVVVTALAKPLPDETVGPETTSDPA
jgi:hypothetical protein